MGSTMEGVISQPNISSDIVPNLLPMPCVIGTYLLASFFVVLLVLIASGFIKKISKLERTLMCWWICTGLTHIIVESYFVFTPEFYKDKTQFYLSEYLKEYNKADSRYARRDSVVVSIEGMTVIFVGFPALLAIYAIATKKSYRYLLQLVLSAAQLYGTIMYLVTAILDGNNFSISPFYYYSYYVPMNSIRVVIAIAISIYCWKKMDTAVHVQDQELHKIKRR